MTNRQFIILAAAIVLLAFGIREWFVLTMTVPNPNQGDVGGYLRYALHLEWDGTFSQSFGAAVPDAFRSPGYPWLLWAVLPGDGSTWADGRWFARVYQVQCLLGAATVAGVIALARLWISRGWALLAGLLMALQPHNIAASGALLTEALFGALIVGGLLAAAYAIQRRSVKLGATSGALFGLGYLTNPVLAFVPFLLAPFGWREARRPMLVMLTISMLAMGGWSARNAMVGAAGGERAGINFVQGSWPEYHDMAKWSWRWPAQWKQLNDEQTLIGQDREAGLRAVAARMASEPGRYAAWYARKPFLLYEWEVRIGKGMTYVVNQRDTVLDRWPLLGAVVVQYTLNPLLSALAVLGLLLAWRQGGPSRMTAVTLLYLTAVHVALQAEPRYAIPYRGLEFVLAFGALAWLTSWAQTALVSRSRPRTARAA